MIPVYLGMKGFQGYGALVIKLGEDQANWDGWSLYPFPRFFPELGFLAPLRTSYCHREGQIPAESEGNLKGDYQIKAPGIPNP